MIKMRIYKLQQITRVVLLGLLFSNFAFAQSVKGLPAGIKYVTGTEGISEYLLESNGLRIILFPDPTKQTLTINTTYLVGTRHENYGERGMAHILEHLAAGKGGTKNFPDLKAQMTKRGVVGSNASTYFDRTNYYYTLPASEDNLKWAIAVEADRMTNSFVSRKDLETEFSVVRNEREMRENNPVLSTIERLTSVSYDWHNYGNQLIGPPSDIENVPIEKVQRFYQTYYQPDNAVILITGKFDEKRALEFVKESFGKIPRPARELPKLYTVEPTQDGERSAVIRRTGDVGVVGIGYRMPPGAHPDFAVLDVISEILTDSPSGRLYKKLVETKKASGIFPVTFNLREPGTAMYFAQVRGGDESELNDVQKMLVQTVENLGNSVLPTKEEVERAKAEILKNIEQTINSSNTFGLQLSEWMAKDDWRLFFLHRDRIKEVTPEDVQRVAKRYFVKSNRTSAMFVPTEKPVRADMPAQPDVAAMLRDFKSKEAVAAGEAFDPSYENIENHTKRAAFQNGMKVALLPKKTRGETVNLRMNLRFGDLESLSNRKSASSLAAEMLLRGTKNLSRQQIQDKLNELKAGLNISGNDSIVSVSANTIRENLPELLKLIENILKNPAFDAAELELLKQARLAAVEQIKSEPMFVAQEIANKHFNAHFPKTDPRYFMDGDEQIASIKATELAEVKKFYADFYGASDATLAIVGDFDEKEILDLTRELFGNWKSPRAYDRIKFEYKDIAAINRDIQTPDKANAFLFARTNINMTTDHPDYPALMLANYIVGNQASKVNRLTTRIRDKEGLSYHTSSNLIVPVLNPTGIFMGIAIFNPQNVAKVEETFKEEIERAVKEGFTKEEIEAAKSGLIQQLEVQRTQDSALAGMLGDYLYYERTLEWDKRLEEKIKSQTAEQVSEALRRYIDPKKITVIKAGDFAKNAK